MGVVAAITDGFRTGGFDAQSLLIDYAASDRFATRREEPSP
jgi:hypothetical protein